MYSPVALFAFNRPYHTNKTLKYLSENEISKETEIFAFIDGARNNTEIHLVDYVEKIIRTYSNKFKKITISRSNQNLSESTNKRIGISNVLSKYENIIVLEDDICVSKYFLEYMNNALVKYKNFKKVWHINGFNYPNESNLFENAFFTRCMEFWGWGTWKDRWFKFRDDPLANDPFYLISKFDKKQIKKFNLDLRHNIRWSMVIANANGELPNTIDIFWEAYIFMNEGLCLSPKISLTRNIGHDDTGENCGTNKELIYQTIQNNINNLYPLNIEEDKEIIELINPYIKVKFLLFKKLFFYIENFIPLGYFIIKIFKVILKFFRLFLSLIYIPKKSTYLKLK